MSALDHWIVNLLADAPRSTHELFSLGYPSGHGSLVTAFLRFEALGYARLNPTTNTYSLTRKAEMRFMKRSKSTGSPTDAPTASGVTSSSDTRLSHAAGGGVLHMAQERDRLVVEMLGEHALATEAAEVDAVLFERLQIAISDGLQPIDLANVPQYRRAAAVEEALDSWVKRTAGGPCDYCGTRSARAPYVSGGYLDDGEVGFTSRQDGTVACAWCSGFLVSHSVQEFREVLFNAVAGTRGLVAVGEYRSDPTLTPLAHEVGYSGVPWGHINANDLDAQVRRRAIALRAQQVVHPSRFCTTAPQAESVSIPGIPAPMHSPDSLPKRDLPWMRRTKKEAREAEAAIAATERFRKEKEAEAERLRIHSEGLRRRDAHLATLDPDEQREYLSRSAQAMGVHDHRKVN